jgi:hypothetical protein
MEFSRKEGGIILEDNKPKSSTRFYHIWASMKIRCDSKDLIKYKYHSARGITYCDRWRIFENFKEDMYETYLKHVEEHGERQTTLDRIDTDGNYEPSNCRWATYAVQIKNRRPLSGTESVFKRKRNQYSKKENRPLIIKRAES